MGEAISKARNENAQFLKDDGTYDWGKLYEYHKEKVKGTKVEGIAKRKPRNTNKNDGKSEITKGEEKQVSTRKRKWRALEKEKSKEVAEENELEKPTEKKKKQKVQKTLKPRAKRKSEVERLFPMGLYHYKIKDPENLGRLRPRR